MSLRAWFAISSAAVMLAALPALAGQGTIRGTVIDDGDDTPLPGANLNLVGILRRTLTGGDGSFSMNVPPGAYTLQATFIGYEAGKQGVEVAAGDTATVNFVLKASAVALGEAFVVIGSRTVRAAVETPAPVDVISEEEIRESGQTRDQPGPAPAGPLLQRLPSEHRRRLRPHQPGQPAGPGARPGSGADQRQAPPLQRPGARERHLRPRTSTSPASSSTAGAPPGAGATRARTRPGSGRGGCRATPST